MRGRRAVIWGAMAACIATGATLVGAGGQGVGQTPGGLPLSQSVRERGSSVTGAYEGWYYGKDGATYALVGYFNRNTKQEFDIPVGPNNRIEPGGPDLGQPTHFNTGRQWGVFAVKLPKDIGNKRLTWTLVANGFTNAITLHTQADYIVEPYEDAANKNTPPKIKFDPNGDVFTGPPSGIAAKYSATVDAPLAIATWTSDEGAKINVPDPNRGRGRGRAGAGAAEPGAAGGAAPAADPDAAPGRGAAAAGRGGAAAQGRGAAGRGRGAAGAEGAPAPRIAVTWTKFRGPGDVKFDNAKPAIDFGAAGKSTTNATFAAPGDYILRVEGNDSTGSGGGGFQCCWTNVHVAVNVKAAGTR
jgi:hypothetical protein